jgi:hypothetical protein
VTKLVLLGYLFGVAIIITITVAAFAIGVVK